MIDTVTLTIPTNRFTLIHPEWFGPDASILWKPGNYLVKCVNNPTAEDKESGSYLPCLTLFKRPSKKAFDIQLRIQFSVPKLLYQNNVDEAAEADFRKVVETLKDKLGLMGVNTSLKAIREADVSNFHASKNIRLETYSSAHVLKTIGKINHNRKLDMSKTVFKNGGQALIFYAKSNSFVIYDKVKDIAQHNGRSIDQNQPRQQLALFKNPDTLEILRLEARLSNRTKLKSLLFHLGYKENPTFEYIFNKELCQKVIQHYWHTLIKEQYYFLFDNDNKPQRILQNIISKLDLKPKQAIYLTGLKVICKDADGIQGLRLCLEKKCSPKTWQRITKDFDLLNSITDEQDYQEWLRQINNEISLFSTFKLANCDVKNSKV